MTNLPDMAYHSRPSIAMVGGVCMKGVIRVRKDLKKPWYYVRWYVEDEGRKYDITSYRGMKMYDRFYAERLLSQMQGGDIVDVERHDSIPSYNRATIEYQKYLGAFMLKYIKPIRPDGLLARMAQFVSEDKTTLYGHIYDWPIRRVGNIYENKNLLKPASTPPATEDAPPAGSKP